MSIHLLTAAEVIAKREIIFDSIKDEDGNDFEIVKPNVSIITTDDWDVSAVYKNHNGFGFMYTDEDKISHNLACSADKIFVIQID